MKKPGSTTRPDSTARTVPIATPARDASSCWLRLHSCRAFRKASLSREDCSRCGLSSRLVRPGTSTTYYFYDAKVLTVLGSPGYALDMAGRHLRALLAAYRDGDDLAFRRAATNLIDAEEANRHVQLARDLRGLLASGQSRGGRPGVERAFLPDPPKDRETDLPLADVQASDRHLSDLVLAPGLHERLSDLAAEVGEWPLLDAAGIPRRRRLLLYGPPGCGKTSVAAALAGDLGRPLVTVRVEAVVSSFLGETASNLRRIFDFADGSPYVVLFDEFDSLGKSRDDPADHGELRRVVNAVLQLIDRYDGPSLLVAATNHEQVLDPALWRRFDEVLAVGLPSVGQIESLLSRTLMGRLDPGVDLPGAASSLHGLPHAAAQRTAQEALRQALRSGRPRVDAQDLRWALAVVLDRRWA